DKTHKRETPTNTAAEYLSHQSGDKVVTAEEIEESLFSETKENARAQLEATLQSALGISKEDLYKKARTSQKRDPLRVALEAAAGHPGTDIASAIGYLEKYSSDQFTQSRISTLTGRRYDPRFTQLAADALRPLLPKPVPQPEASKPVTVRAATVPQIRTANGFQAPR
ncbi:MAG: hypothetical protein HOQ05_07050, partial [Corynebacteriales bacterium]|nr:hypothetical protein [Mycobacteriales bacterium]